jgi:DNA-binding NarL/FixJ family response regulator
MQIGAEMTKVVEGRRIFVVDDNEIFRAAIQFALHDEYETHELESATGALAKAERMKPDLLVLAEDVIRANGLDLIQEYLARIPDAKILVIIDQISSGFDRECVAAGVHGVLAKPLRIELVRDKVDALLSAKKKSDTNPLSVLNVR